MKNLISTLSFLLINTFLLGQTATIGGMITDENSQPIEGVKIELRGTKDYGAISNSQGRFRISNVNEGDYTLIFSSPAHDSLKKEVSVSAPFTRLGRFKLEPRSFNLDEVKIEADVAQAQQKGDTTQYNAGAFKTNPDATAEDLIEKMPGVVVENGTVQAQGEDVKQVLVDGRPFFGNDPLSGFKESSRRGS